MPGVLKHAASGGANSPGVGVDQAADRNHATARGPAGRARSRSGRPASPREGAPQASQRPRRSQRRRTRVLSRDNRGCSPLRTPAARSVLVNAISESLGCGQYRVMAVPLHSRASATTATRFRASLASKARPSSRSPPGHGVDCESTDQPCRLTVELSYGSRHQCRRKFNRRTAPDDRRSAARRG